MTVWIKSGTVAVTNGSATVQGTGTGLYGKVAPGYAFVGPDGRIYEVLSVNLAEQITLASPYLGATASGAAYAIYPTLGLAAQLVAAVQALITAQQAIEASEVVAANGDRQFYSAEGAVIAMLKNSGRLGVGAGNTDPKSLLSLRSINPSIDLVETDSPVAGEISRILRNGGYVDFQTVDGDTLISNDYRMQLGALGALRHEWRINNSPAMVLNSNGFLGLGTASPQRWLHVSQPLATSSTRMRLENGDGWTDLLADNGEFKVTSNVTGGGDASFLQYNGLLARLGVNVTPLDQLHVHEPSNNGAALRLSNNEGYARFIQDAGGDIALNQNGHVAHFFEDYGRIDINGKSDNNNHKLGVFTANMSYGNDMVRIAADRPASTNFDYLRALSNYAATNDTEFKLRGDGNAFADGSWSGGGADFAEFFEWEDGNTAAEDRRGISVVLSGDKIRPALTGEDPFGVVSANPTVIGDADLDRWKGKFLRDEYGSYVLEDFQVVSWEALRPTQDPDTGAFGGALVPFSFAVDAVPEGIAIPEDAEYATEQRRVVNPEWNSEEVYVPRAERAEWDAIGFLGKLRLRKGQPVSSRWIKMRDINEDVEEWLVR